MAWENSTYTPQLAVERGWTTWDVFLTGWGLRDGGAVEVNSLLFPNPASQATIPSIYGAMIGPYSDIDRCLIQYVPNLGVPAGSVPPEYNIFDQKLLSVNNPVIAPLGGPISVVCDQHTQTQTTFTVAGTATSQVYDFMPDGLLSEPPRLHVVFFLQASPQLGGTLVRYPKNYSPQVVGGNGTAQFAGAFPIFGRNKVTLTIKAANGIVGTITVRVGIIVPGLDNNFVERTVTTTAALAANVMATVSLTDLCSASYITLWGTGSGPGTVADVYMELRD